MTAANFTKWAYLNKKAPEKAFDEIQPPSLRLVLQRDHECPSMANSLHVPSSLPGSKFVNTIEEMFIANVADESAAVARLAVAHTSAMLPTTALLAPEIIT
jgi:hypothetical protein